MEHKTLLIWRRGAVGALAALLCWAAGAQEFPNRPIRLVVPQPPGGGTDILARNMAQKLTEVLRQPTVVENRAGAGSLVGTEFVAKAPADGHTLLMGGIFNMVMNKALIKNLSYEPARDFIPLGYISAYPFVMLARTDLPVNNMADLVKYGKERPGRLSYGSGGVGTLQHVWGAVLLSSLGIEALHVPFKGAAPAHQEMMGGRLDVMFDNMSASKQYVQTGKLKGLVVSSAARSPLLAQVPTVNETGLTRFEGESWFGIFAPAGTPPAVVQRISAEVAKALTDPQVRQQLDAQGVTPVGSTPAESAAFHRKELDKFKRAVEISGATME